MHKKLEFTEIVHCCELRFDRGPALDWKHGDFSDLSREILRETGVNISSNTLKRIFGKIAVDEYYLPQQATLEALREYGRYDQTKPRQTFTATVVKPQEVTQQAEGPEVNPGKPITPDGFKKYRPIFFIPILLAIVFGLAVLLNRKTEPKLSGDIKPAGIEGILPATAFFNLQLPDRQDSLFVDFGDKSALLYVKPGQKSVAHIYIFPGVFRVSLKTRQATIATQNVSIRSDKWIGLAYPPQGSLPFHYYEAPAVKGNDSLFHIPNRQLHETGIDTIGTFYTQLCNFTPKSYAGEDFVFEASFKNALPGNRISCQGTQFQISGSTGIIRFKLVNAGCSYRVINVISEQTFDGRIENLSRFVTDLEKWNTVKLVNQKRKVLLYVNGKQMFKGSYQKPLGKIEGLFLEFEGNGSVKSCELKKMNGDLLYRF